MGRGDRVRLRQPRMQWENARLHAEPEQSQGKGHRCPDRAQLYLAEGVKREILGERGKDAEAEQNQHRADLGHQQIEKCGPPVGRLMVLVGHQEIARYRHQFPGDQERECIIRQQDQLHADDKQHRHQSEQAQ